MNVWLDKSEYLISAPEWNNLPPPDFFAEKVAESGNCFVYL